MPKSQAKQKPQCKSHIFPAPCVTAKYLLEVAKFSGVHDSCSIRCLAKLDGEHNWRTANLALGAYEANQAGGSDHAK